MRRILELAAIVAVLAVALFFAQRKQVDAPIGANALLYLVADSQRDLTRMPSHFTRLSDGEEIRAGDAVAGQILANRPMTDTDRAAEAHVIATAERLSRFVHRRRIPIHAHLIPDAAFTNAFAIPGGHVFIGTGLLLQVKTEDQLAYVMAHEIEHVDHYHCAERLQVEAAFRKIPLGAVLQIPVEVFQAGYTKDQELEADREGVLLAAKAGYSAEGALDMLNALSAMNHETERPATTPQEELGRVTLSAMTGYFRSHPATPDRIAQVRAMIAGDPSLAAIAQRPIARP